MIRTPWIVALLCLCPIFARAQGVSFSSQITQKGTILTTTNALLVPAAPTVNFCNSPANATPCTNKATTYTDATLTTSCALSTQIVLDGTNTCVATPDANDNWRVWIAVGDYEYTITVGGSNYGPFHVTASVPTKFNPNNLNSIIFVDGVTYPLNSTGLTNACTAAGSSGTVGISKPIVMTANVTCSSAIQSFAGGTITTTGWTLTLNGALTAPPVQIFIGTGTITLLGGQPSHAVWFPGADIIAQIVNDYASFPSAPSAGTILVDPNPSGGCWSATTAGVLNRVGVYPTIQGITPGGSTSLFARGGNCINYTPTTATNALTLDYVPSNGSSYVPSHGIRDLTLINNACTTNGGCGSSATGIAMGATNGGAQRGYFGNLLIEGFGTGFANANGVSWGQQFENDTWTHNGVGAALTAGPLENMQFTFDYWVTNGTAFTNNGADVAFNGGGFDSNTGGSLNIAGYSATSTSTATFSGFHFENFNCGTQNCVHYINSTGQVAIVGGEVLDDTAGAANRDYSIQVNNATIRGLTISSATETFTNFALVNGFADMQFMVASANLTPCPTFATTSVCSTIGTGVATPFVHMPILGLGTTAGSYNLIATGGDSGHTGTFPANTGTVSETNFAETFSGVKSFNSGTLLPSAAGGTDLGSAALPFGNAWLGTAATNNFKFSPVATAAARTVTLNDTNGVAIDISAAKTGTAITVRTIALTAVAAQFTTIDCKAQHD